MPYNNASTNQMYYHNLFIVKFIQSATLSGKKKKKKFRATFTKFHPIRINHFGHRSALILVNMRKTHRVDCAKKEETAVKLQKETFLKIAQTAHLASSMEAAYSEHSIPMHSISMAGYVTAAPAFVCRKVPAPEASSFCDF